MYTYVIKSCGYYKIGKTQSIESRLKVFETHNPNFELVYLINIDCENYLHCHFYKKRYKLEWFTLEIEDLEWIRDNEDKLQYNRQDLVLAREKEERDKKTSERVYLQRKNALINKEKQRIKKENYKLKQKEDDEKLKELIKTNPEIFT